MSPLMLVVTGTISTLTVSLEPLAIPAMEGNTVMVPVVPLPYVPVVPVVMSRVLLVRRPALARLRLLMAQVPG